MEEALAQAQAQAQAMYLQNAQAQAQAQAMAMHQALQQQAFLQQQLAAAGMGGQGMMGGFTWPYGMQSAVVQQQLAASSPAGPMDELTKLHMLNLDKSALEAVMKLSPEDRAAVLNEVNPAAAKNPSAVVWKHIRERDKGGGKGPNPDAVEPNAAAVQVKINLLSLDQACLEALSRLTIPEQATVLSQINPEAARNHSAVLWSKMRAMGVSRGSREVAAPMGAFGAGRERSRSPRNIAPPGMLPANFNNMMQVQPHSFAMGAGMQSSMMSPSFFNAVQAMQPMMANQFAGFTAPSQSHSFAMPGAVGGCATGVAAPGGGAPAPPAVDADRLKELGLDEAAIQVVMALDLEGQHIVAYLVGLPSAAATGDISAVALSKAAMVKGSLAAAREEYCQTHIDNRSLDAIANLPVEGRCEIFSDINVLKCRNLSAVVWSKVRGWTHMHGVAPSWSQQSGCALAPMGMTSAAPVMGMPSHMMGMTGMTSPMGAAGMAPQMGMCASMGLPMGSPMGSPMGMGPPGMVASMSSGSLNDPPDMAAILGIQLDHRCHAELRKLPIEQQQAILSEVDPTTTRNISAFVWSKVKERKQIGV